MFDVYENFFLNQSSAKLHFDEKVNEWDALNFDNYVNQ